MCVDHPFPRSKCSEIKTTKHREKVLGMSKCPLSFGEFVLGHSKHRYRHTRAHTHIHTHTHTHTQLQVVFNLLMNLNVPACYRH